MVFFEVAYYRLHEHRTLIFYFFFFQKLILIFSFLYSILLCLTWYICHSLTWQGESRSSPSVNQVRFRLCMLYKPFHLQCLISYFPLFLSYISLYASSENLVSYQENIPLYTSGLFLVQNVMYYRDGRGWSQMISLYGAKELCLFLSPICFIIYW